MNRRLVEVTVSTQFFERLVSYLDEFSIAYKKRDDGDVEINEVPIICDRSAPEGIVLWHQHWP